MVKKGQTINASLYVNDILPEVFSNFMEKSERTTVRDVMLHHDNAAPHKAAIVRSIFETNEWNFSLTHHTVQTLPLVIFSYSLESKKNWGEKIW